MKYLAIILVAVTCLSCSKNFGTCDCSWDTFHSTGPNSITKHSSGISEHQHQPGESCEELGERLSTEASSTTFSCEVQ